MLLLSGSSLFTHKYISEEQSDIHINTTHFTSGENFAKKMESSKVMSSDKATVIIQVNPQVAKDTVICDDGQQVTGAYHNTALKGFFNAQPKALGTVQIMFGVVIFLIGIVLTANPYSGTYPAIFIISGITYWGSLIYIIAGSLSVAAQNKLHPCVVKASLAMNVISAITGVISITLMGIEMLLISEPYRRCSYSYDYTGSEVCSRFKKYEMGIIGVLLVFSILQCIVSICISGFACKATCNTDSTVVNVALNQGY
ncbi:membrane-spanning 4-domains, subfamily A, member 17C.1 isoform X1 [Labeo rohita]|uniref:membrane-spanning 4-domains, subfamily A, member 17C.1 isoform X1 n=1 Tax=Labeo rohita TaxID=84645 RepID=UPI0021E29199|nr:membrane-spanning 4-domains, subfamily A, member 17C.1 isoform X1 [Labeo rohita]